MIEFVVNKKREHYICDFEMKMLMKYKEIISAYTPLFDAVGCELRVELGWHNSIRKTWSKDRIPLRNGYACYIYCIVEKGGEEIHIKTNDGEADYYLAEAEWMVSSVNRRFHRLKVSLYNDLDNIDLEMKGLLSKLRYVK